MSRLHFTTKPKKKKKEEIQMDIKQHIEEIKKEQPKEVIIEPIEEKERPKIDDIPNDIKEVKIKDWRSWNWTRIILYLTTLGIVGIIFFTQYVASANPAFIILIWLFGMMCFLPMGLFLGWIFLDPYMRCKLLRRFRGKNYGIVNFVHRGGQRIETRIKNFDDDVVLQEGKLWYLTKEGIYYLNKNNNKVFYAKIEPENIKTLPANIPVLFLDSETMKPLSFQKEISKTDPAQAGALIMGYMNNQIQKNKALKSSQTLLGIITIAITVINLIIAIQLYQWVEEIYNLLPQLQHTLQQLSQVLSEQQTPAGLISLFGWL